jgi:hypothetical protein
MQLATTGLTQGPVAACVLVSIFSNTEHVVEIEYISLYFLQKRRINFMNNVHTRPFLQMTYETPSSSLRHLTPLLQLRFRQGFHCANDCRILLVVSKNVYNTQNCYIHGIRKDE